MNKLLTTTLLFLLGTALVSCAGVNYTGVGSGDSDSVSIRVDSFGDIIAELDKTFIVADDHCSKYGKYSSHNEVITKFYKTAYFSCFTAEQLLMMNGRLEGHLPKIIEDNLFRENGAGHPLTNLMLQPNNVRNFAARYGSTWANSPHPCTYNKSDCLSTANPMPTTDSAPTFADNNSSNIEKCKSFGFADDTPEMANCLFELYKLDNQPQQNTAITNSAPARTNSSDTTSGIELMNRGLQILNGVGTPSAPSSRTSTCTRIGDISGQVVTFNSIACPAGYAPTF